MIKRNKATSVVLFLQKNFDGDLSNVNTNGYHLYVNGTLAK